mmetsp:Transcript_10234/g.20875  ORF Transcript_10234/g.20875 Transcript_10234/m.20875 type:complete len:171 (-) Transcript_10234:175-687(-)
MAKSLRSKVKKRLRTVKRGVVKRELLNPESKLGKRETQKESMLQEALSGYLKPGVRRKNAFRSDDPEAEIPQHDFRQGPDYRSGSVGDSGYAVVGSNRPKPGKLGGDAPSARPTPKPGTMTMDADMVQDAGVARLLKTTERIVPFNSSKRTKKRLKNKSGVDTKAAFRWA